MTKLYSALCKLNTLLTNFGEKTTFTLYNSYAKIRWETIIYLPLVISFSNLIFVLYTSVEALFRMLLILQLFSFSCQFILMRSTHTVWKSAQIRSFSLSVFSRVWSEYGKILTRKNSVFEHFSRSVTLRP